MSFTAWRYFAHVVLPLVVGAGAAWFTRRPHEAPVGGVSPAAGAPAGESTAPATLGAARSPLLATQQAFCERLRTADWEDLKVMINEVNAIPDAFRRRWVRDLVMERMARLNPQALVQFSAIWYGGDYKHYFIAAWGRVDAQAAVTWAQAQGKEAKTFTYELVKNMVPDQLDDFLRILPQLQPEQLPSEQATLAFRLLGERDATEAVKAAGLIPAGGKQNTALNAAAEGWARRDPTAAWEWAQALESPAARESALRGVLSAWCERDPAGAAAKFAELPGREIPGEDGKDLVKGNSPLQAITRAWATLDAKAAAAWLRSLPGAEDGQFSDLLRSQILPTRDVWDAVELTEIIRKPGGDALPEDWKQLFSSTSSWWDGERSHSTVGQWGGNHSPLSSQGKSQFAVENPATAFEAVAKLPADGSRQHMLQEVADQWVKIDPQAALGRLKETSDPALKLSLMNALMNEGDLSGDFTLVAAAAEATPEGVPRHRFSNQYDAYTRLATTDPERALAMLQGDAPKEARTALASALAERQARYDPEGAMQWAAQQPDDWRNDATHSAMQAWAVADAFAASEWLAAQPPGAARDAAVAGLVSQLTQTSPEDAIEWTKAFSDPKMQELRQTNIISNLIYQNPRLARRLLETATLPDSVKADLQARIIQRSGNH